MRLRPTELVLGQPRLPKETLSQKTNPNQSKNKKQDKTTTTKTGRKKTLGNTYYTAPDWTIPETANHTWKPFLWDIKSQTQIYG